MGAFEFSSVRDYLSSCHVPYPRGAVWSLAICGRQGLYSSLGFASYSSFLEWRFRIYLFFSCVGGKCTIQFLCYDTQQDTFLFSCYFLFEDLILTLNRVCFSSVRVTLGVIINVFLCGCLCEFIKANLI